jgi:hypothetical protein
MSEIFIGFAIGFKFELNYKRIRRDESKSRARSFDARREGMRPRVAAW